MCIRDRFNDGGATLISPENNASKAENFRISEQAMRVYLNLRDDAADSVIMSGSYIWGTAADWDFNENKLSSCLLSGNFTGMGHFTVGASVTASGVFSLSTGKSLVCNGANVDGATVNGDFKLQGSTITTINNFNVTGAFDFDTAGTYSLNGCTIGEVTNSSGGNITINIDINTTITTNTDLSLIHI